MKSTGITRRIDDLGRIVIPKEIRTNLKIKDNEILEIYIAEENIILKKFSSFNNMDKILLKVLEDETLSNVLITNRDKVIDSSNKNYINKEIGFDILNVIKTKKELLNNKKDDIELVLNNEINTNSYIKPIINNGDIIGTISIFKDKTINEKEILIVDIISKLIINYIY